MEETPTKIPSFPVSFERKTRVADTAHVFRFRVAEHFDFQPGQYVWLILHALAFPDPRGERRAFSIISSNQEKDYIEFLVRDSESGYKRTLHALEAGDEARIIGPFGHAFVIPEDNKEDITCIVGGVGIAPFIGILRSLTKRPPYRLRILHCTPPESGEWDIDVLSAWAMVLGIDIVCMQGSFDGRAVSPDTPYATERFYVAGPQEFVNEVGAFLDRQHVPRDHQHYEENYPEPQGNLTENDFQECSGRYGVMHRAVLESKVHTIITDANGKIIFANPAAERGSGYTFAEMRGNTPRLWGGLMPLEAYQKFWRERESVNVFEGRPTNHRKNGEIYSMASRIFPIRNDAGVIIGHIGIEEELTEKLKLVRELEHAKARDEAVLANVTEGLVVVDSEGKFIFVNKAAKRMVGISGEPVSVRDWPKTYGMYGLDGEELIDIKDFAPMLALRGTVVEGTKIRIKNEQYPEGLILRILASPIVVGSGVVGAVMTFIDISKEQQIDRAKSEFVSLASHQLRTPLSTIGWYTEMLLDGDAGAITSEQRKYLEEVYAGNQRMVELVNALLNVSRLELGTFLIEPEPTDVLALAQSVIEEQKPQIEARHIRTETDFANDLPLIPADQKLLRMVFQNLLSNAVKYTPQNGRITMRITKHETYFEGCITDSGIGIPKEEQPRIFSKLYRATNARETETDGTGLGLYIVKSIIDQSGGTIYFGSEQGKGTTFCFTLPLTGMRKKAGTKHLDE